MQRLVDQRMIGNLALAHDVFQARDLIGEHRGKQVFALHALQLRRHFLAALEARQGERGGGVPAPARGEQRRIEQRLHQHVFGGVGVQVARHFFQREAVAGGERQHDGIFGGRCLQFEVELAAEALAQGQAPGAIDAAAPGRVDDQLGAARLVEETLEHQRFLRGQHAERSLGCGHVFGQLLGGGFVHAQRMHQPVHDGGYAAFIDARGDFFAQTRYAVRQLRAAPRRFAQPERNIRRHALRVFHAQAIALHANDAVAGVAELEDVAGEAFHGEVFVHRADDGGLRFQHHQVVGGVGDGAA